MTNQTKELSIEESLGKLESIINELEQKDLPLETSLQKFEEGIALSKHAQGALTKAEQKIQQLTQKNGEQTLEPIENTTNA